MPTIVVTTTPKLWEAAKANGRYERSTITTPLAEVGFIHATRPRQTLAMLKRHFAGRDDLLLLLIDLDKVHADVKFEAPLSGRPGVFPHIYGPLNLDAVYATLKPTKNSSGEFRADELARLS